MAKVLAATIIIAKVRRKVAASKIKFKLDCGKTNRAGSAGSRLLLTVIRLERSALKLLASEPLTRLSRNKALSKKIPRVVESFFQPARKALSRNKAMIKYRSN